MKNRRLVIQFKRISQHEIENNSVPNTVKRFRDSSCICVKVPEVYRDLRETKKGNVLFHAVSEYFSRIMPVDRDSLCIVHF